MKGFPANVYFLEALRTYVFILRVVELNQYEKFTI